MAPTPSASGSNLGCRTHLPRHFTVPIFSITGNHSERHSVMSAQSFPHGCIEELAELRDERAQIEQAILAIERLASGRGKRRGRPPSWMKAAACDMSRIIGGGSSNPHADLK